MVYWHSDSNRGISDFQILKKGQKFIKAIQDFVPVGTLYFEVLSTSVLCGDTTGPHKAIFYFLNSVAYNICKVVS